MNKLSIVSAIADALAKNPRLRIYIDATEDQQHMDCAAAEGSVSIEQVVMELVEKPREELAAAATPVGARSPNTEVQREWLTRRLLTPVETDRLDRRIFDRFRS